MRRGRAGALLVVVLLSVGRVAHQQSVSNDDDDAAESADTVDVMSRLETALNQATAVKRHIGKFVRIGRSSSSSPQDDDDDDDWALRWYPPLVRRLSERRWRSQLFNTVDATTRDLDSSDVVRAAGLLPPRSTEAARPSTVDDLQLHWRRHGRVGTGGGGGVRFVRIGRSGALQGQKSLDRPQRSDSGVNIYKRSLENRFVRIGK